MTDAQVWIGLVELRGSADNAYLEGGVGAFANLVAAAADESEFADLANREARMMGLEVVAIEWSRPLQLHLEQHDVSERILGLAPLLGGEQRALFDVLHVWDESQDGEDQ
jgi:hypothetical protein